MFLLQYVANRLSSYTDTSSGSEDEGSLQGDSQGTPTSSQGSINMEHWISQAIHGSTTSTTSWSSTQSGDSRAANRLADVMAQTHMDNHSAPPDVTTYTSEHSIQMERPQGSTGSRTAPKYCNAELMETGNSTSQSRDVFFSGKRFVLMSRSVPVTGCVSSWGTICCHFIC
uniref:disco-interacting protein 2 homolog C-like n=1 Tax=Macaca mulatta TaxID=9544 RepID=UPI0007327E90|nr:disco-interacting protein 2 homolog C-like [Macaca mulatta]